MAFDITKINDVAQVAADITNGRSLQGYSTEDGNKLVYDALVDANNGKTYLDPRDLRDGKVTKEELDACSTCEGCK